MIVGYNAAENPYTSQSIEAVVGERSPNEAAQYLKPSHDDLKAKRSDSANNLQWQNKAYVI
jgi:hypothetical protein